jgi:hypothetical protein
VKEPKPLFTGMTKFYSLALRERVPDRAGEGFFSVKTPHPPPYISTEDEVLINKKM